MLNRRDFIKSLGAVAAGTLRRAEIRTGEEEQC